MWTKLARWELDRLAVIEVCVDELLSTIDRHGGDEDVHRAAATISHWLDANMLTTLGAERRYSTLKTVRDALNAAYPSPTTT